MATSRVPSDLLAYWSRRLGSSGFRQALATVLSEEIRHLGTLRFKEIIDPVVVRRAIDRWDKAIMHAAAVGDTVVDVQRRGRKRLERQRSSAKELLGRSMADHIEGLVAAGPAPAADLEASLNRLVQQDLITTLLTDLVYASISSFYQRLNPLFGGFAMRTLEDQIKTFIRRFMPMLQERVTAFLLNDDNQRMAQQLTRSLVREVLNQPLASYAAMATPLQHRQIEALLRTAVGSDEVDALGRRMARAVFDDLFAVIRNRKVGEVLQLERHADALADDLADAVLPLLKRPAFVAFLARETAQATASVPPPKPRRARKTPTPTPSSESQS